MNNFFFDKINLKWIGLTFILIFITGCPEESHDSDTTLNKKISPPENQLSYVECNGTLHPGKRFILKLGIGERVSKLLINQGATVDKGTPLAILTNDDLYQQIAVLEEMELTTWQEQQNLRLLGIEIKNEEKTRQELEDLITEERRIGEKITGYQVAKETRQWQEKLNRTLGQIRVLKERLDIQKQSYAKQKNRMASQETLLAGLKLRVGKLKVLAPFGGIVKRIHTSAQSATPGELVLELWDESSGLIIGQLRQNQVIYVRPGNRVEIYPDFYQNTCLEGTVQSIKPAETNREINQFPTFPVLIEMKKQDHNLVIGMTVSLRIIIEDSAKGGTSY